MNRLILTSLLVTFAIAAAFPSNVEFGSDTTYIDLYKVNWTSHDLLIVPANGTLFNPDPSAFPIERLCIGRNVPSCAFGAEDGTWIAVFNDTNHGCVDISPALVLNNGFCCVSLDDCTLLNRPFLQARAVTSSPLNSTLVKVFGSTTYYISVQNNGIQETFNRVGALVDRVCMLTNNTMSCGLGAEDGTWIQVYNQTDDSCFIVSPPAALNTIACCNNFIDCPALDGPFRKSLQVREVAEVAIPAGTLTLSSSKYEAQSLPVRADGYTFSFGPVHDQISRVCISNGTMSCLLKAIDGTAYAASTLGGNGCIDINSNNLLQQGFCCKDFASCPGLNKLPSRSSTLNQAPAGLKPRIEGPTVDTVLPLMFEGAPDLVGWEYVRANLVGFNVTSAIPWSVGQICMMNNQGICAFVGMDGTVTSLIGGRDGNCAVVAPPQLLIDGICCPSYTQCNGSAATTLGRLVGNATMASYMGTNSSSNTTNTSTAVASQPTLAARAADLADITIEYYGPSGDYGLDWETGDYTTFTPSVSWGVDQVCIISPQGFCGFWSTDETLGFEVGPVADGQSSACYTVGGAYVLAGGICCRSSDGCYSASRSAKALSVRDSTASNDTPPTREITFYGDPAFYVEAGGVRTSLQIVADGRIEPLVAFGQPVVEVCLNAGICQFYIGGTLDLGPGILSGNGGCIGFQPSVTLTGVACN